MSNQRIFCGRCHQIIVQGLIPGSSQTWVAGGDPWCHVVGPLGQTTDTAHYPATLEDDLQNCGWHCSTWADDNEG